MLERSELAVYRHDLAAKAESASSTLSRPGTQWVGVSSPHARAAGVTPGQGAYKQQPMSPQTSGTTNQCFSLSSPTPLNELNIF